MAYTRKATDATKTLQGLIVPHTKFNIAVNHIEDAVEIGRFAGTFAGVRVSAPAGAGKSALLDFIRSRMEQSNDEERSKDMIFASVKELPSVSQVQTDLLKNYNYAAQNLGRSSANNNDVNLVLVKAITHHRTRLIALDEFQHIFLSGGLKVATSVVDWLKRLMNLVRVPVVLLGTESMDRLEGLDEQLTSRIPTVVRLSYFSLNAEWRGFLNALATGCREFDLSLIGKDRETAVSLWEATKGSPRETKGLLRHAICIGVMTERMELTRELLREAFVAHFGVDTSRENPFATD
ncbi:TniB family NTP-binding protein [Achromobacter sp. KK8]